jgi:hypothetical protein
LWEKLTRLLKVIHVQKISHARNITIKRKISDKVIDCILCFPAAWTKYVAKRVDLPPIAIPLVM